MAGGAEVQLLITDVNMPKLGGPALVQELLPRSPGLKVLYISGARHENRLLQRHIIEMGCGFLAKPFTPADLMQRIHRLLPESAGGPEARSADWGVLWPLLEAAISAAAAQMGTIQVADNHAECLRIAVQRGFERPYLDFFAEVRRGHRSTCGAAYLSGRRVIVEDVMSSDLLRGSETLPVLLAAGVRAIQSTPLIARNGDLVGMLSTHCREPACPAEGCLAALDELAIQAAERIAETPA